jgi:peptidoglycan/LPS O-acetylase OafA/YrhL
MAIPKVLKSGPRLNIALPRQSWLNSFTVTSRLPNLGDLLKKYNGVGPGFDLIRLGLALLIMFGHCFWVAGAGPAVVPITAIPDAAEPATHWVPVLFEGQRQIKFMLVPMFFALSGFLVTGSAFRTNSLRSFLVFRTLRILPALSVEVTLSAIILGPLLTTEILSNYFTGADFYRYFGNIFGFVHFELPGLFLSNPVPRIVNINLWTLPGEFYCYLLTAAVMATGFFTHRRVFTGLFLAATVCWMAAHAQDGFATGRIATTDTLIYYFFCGCFLFHWRDYVPISPVLFALSAIASYLFYTNGISFLAPLFLTYVVVFVGMLALPRLPLLQTGDYSYGIYLYGFPIAQALVLVSPSLRGQGWLVALLAIPATLLFAAASWHLIEKRALLLKRRFAPSAARVSEALIRADESERL